MTTVIFRKTKQGEYREIKCKGHAEYAESGNDIVCAAVSVLIINTLNSLEELCGLSVKPRKSEKKGLLAFELPEELDERAVVLLDSLALGCVSIEKEYGKKYCKVKFEEV